MRDVDEDLDEKNDEIDYKKLMLFHVTDYQEKIHLCMHKTEACKAKVTSDAEINLLQKELDEELQKETLLQDDLR
ncbi:hypothetical protein Tco_1387158 [Tanacetum coccineum]